MLVNKGTVEAVCSAHIPLYEIFQVTMRTAVVLINLQSKKNETHALESFALMH